MKVAPEEGVYKVVSPLGKSICEIAPSRSTCLLDLSGKTICELWNWRFRGEEIFSIIEELLLERYPGIKFMKPDLFGDIHAPNQSEVIAALPDKLYKQGCDAVISGIGA